MCGENSRVLSLRFNGAVTLAGILQGHRSHPLADPWPPAHQDLKTSGEPFASASPCQWSSCPFGTMPRHRAGQQCNSQLHPSMFRLSVTASPGTKPGADARTDWMAFRPNSGILPLPVAHLVLPNRSARTQKPTLSPSMTTLLPESSHSSRKQHSDELARLSRKTLRSNPQPRSSRSLLPVSRDEDSSAQAGLRPISPGAVPIISVDVVFRLSFAPTSGARPASGRAPGPLLQDICGFLLHGPPRRVHFD